MEHFKLLMVLAVLVCVPSEPAPLPDADRLLEQAERFRSPQEDYASSIVLLDDHHGKKSQRTYEALIKGKRKALVRFLTPESDRGTRLLLADNDMWVYIPSSARPIRIAPRQKLMGNAAYGDVVRLNFIGNYRSSFLRTERVKNRAVYVLRLSAIEGRPVTYDQIEYWIDAETHVPVKAVYMTGSGKALRDCYFDRFESVLGTRRPTRFVLVDHFEPQHVTAIVFSKFKRGIFPDLLFEKENFARD